MPRKNTELIIYKQWLIIINQMIKIFLKTYTESSWDVITQAVWFKYSLIVKSLSKS